LLNLEEWRKASVRNDFLDTFVRIRLGAAKTVPNGAKFILYATRTISAITEVAKDLF
jgi:hypothetical protein